MINSHDRFQRAPSKSEPASPSEDFTRHNAVIEWARMALISDLGWLHGEEIHIQWTELLGEFTKLKYCSSRYEEFLRSNPATQKEITLKNRLQNFLNQTNSETIHRDNQALLHALMEKIGGFPGIAKYGRNVAHTACLVLRQADNNLEFQKKGLALMYDCRRQSPGQNSAELTHFYYLLDRITVVLGYQYFGTHNPQPNIIALPSRIKPYFNDDPAYFCVELSKIELPKGVRSLASQSEMHELWSLAAQDGLKNIEAILNLAKYKKN